VIPFKTTVDFPQRVTITSALPYVNGVKHLGNLVGSLLPADIFHRFLDSFGVDNIYVCGTDDHGTAVEIAAAAEGVSPQAFVKKYHLVQKEIYEKWDIDFTFFGNTSSHTNVELTQAIFLAAHRNGYVLTKTLIVPFCESDQRYLPDRYIMGTCPVCGNSSARGDQCELCGTVLDPSDLKDPQCNLCGSRNISFKQEKHLFLDYHLLSPKLEAWIKTTDWPYNTKNLALGWIKQGLKPRGVTRNLEWGINVPLREFKHLVFYVWFDAPIGYIAITKDAHHAGKIHAWKEYWTDSAIYHFLGKDNIPFHTIFWPGTLIAARDTELAGDRINFLLPSKVVGYEYLNWGGQKFSTSKGIGLFTDEALDLFPTDYWRFYLSYLLPENRDSNFDWDDFAKRVNNELIANYGNLFYRVTHFIRENFSGVVPKAVMDKDGEELLRKLVDSKQRIEQLVKDVQLREALKEALHASAEVNKYFQDRRPWAAIKEDSYGAANTIFTAVNALRTISIMLYPFIPTTAQAALDALDTEKDWGSAADVKLKPGHRVEAKLLFKKIEDKELDKAKAYISRYAKKIVSTDEKKEDKKEVTKPMVTFDDFDKLDLVVGTIMNVDDHSRADKLYVLQVDLGNEIRQIVAGLRTIYKKEDLKGRQIIVVANLEPKELRGMKSHGMLLAAADGTVISPEKPVPNGSRIG
jgi:methionyl-tRNA synthetase